MVQLLRQPLFYIFFIYGASFWVMSYMVFYGIRKATSITLVTTFYVLVLFGLTHGTSELIDWLRFILNTTGTGEGDVLKYLSQTFMIISFIILLQFGVNLLTYKNENKEKLRLIPAALVAVYIALLFAARVDDTFKAGVIARYSFGFLGALLSSVALFSLSGPMKAVGNPKLINGLIICAVGFALYSVFGGLIVKPIAGRPIQLFRAACALTIAISSFYILDVFKVEST